MSEIREQMMMQKRELVNPQKMQLSMAVVDLAEERQELEESNVVMENGQRVPRRAGKRHSEAAKKKRKVTKGQVTSSA